MRKESVSSLMNRHTRERRRQQQKNQPENQRKVRCICIQASFIAGLYAFLHAQFTSNDIMNKNGPIIILEDDPDDQDIISEIFAGFNYENELMFFTDGFIALDFLIKSEVKPFLIISDINLPKLNGIELREKIHNNEQLRLRCIPYLFLTSSSNHRDVIDAYSKSVQGFFIKPDSLSKFEEMLRKIVEYWQECLAPNKLT